MTCNVKKHRQAKMYKVVGLQLLRCKHVQTSNGRKQHHPIMQNPNFNIFLKYTGPIIDQQMFDRFSGHKIWSFSSWRCISQSSPVVQECRELRTLQLQFQLLPPMIKVELAHLD